MPEQSDHHQEENTSEQQINHYQKAKEIFYENNRCDRTGRIQCRN